MPRRRRYNREKTRNLAWQTFSDSLVTPLTDEKMLLAATEVQDYETVVERQRGVIGNFSGGDQQMIIIASIVLPENMTSATPGNEINESNFPDPEADGTDDWPLWQAQLLISDYQQLHWDSKAKRRIPKGDVLYTILKFLRVSGTSVNLPYVGRTLTSWQI